MHEPNSSEVVRITDFVHADAVMRYENSPPPITFLMVRPFLVGRMTFSFFDMKCQKYLAQAGCKYLLAYPLLKL